MAKKKRQLVTGKHAKTYDREFRQYLNMYEDAKGVNKIPYYSDENKFYLLKKSEKKTIKQLYDKSSKARSMFRPNLFLSKKGSLFELNKDGSVVYRESRKDEKTGREKWQICFTPKLKEEGGTNIQVYQLTNLLFGEITPKAQELLDEEGLSAMVKLKSTDKTKVRTHHNKGKGINPKYTHAMREESHTVIHGIEIYKEPKILEDLKEQLKLTQVLSEETGDQSYMAIPKDKNVQDDKAKLILLDQQDTKEVEKELVSLLWQGIQQADQDLKKSFIEHIQQQSDQQGFESVNQYFQKLASDENTNITQEFLNDQYLKYVKDHKQER